MRFLLLMLVILFLLVISVMMIMFILSSVLLLCFSESMDSVKLLLGFYLESSNLFFAWLWIDFNFILKLFDCLIYFSNIARSKNVQMAESVHRINAVTEVTFLFSFFFLFLFFHLLRSFLIQFAFFPSNDLTTFFHLFLPLFIF